MEPCGALPCPCLPPPCACVRRSVAHDSNAPPPQQCVRTTPRLSNLTRGLSIRRSAKLGVGITRSAVVRCILFCEALELRSKGHIYRPTCKRIPTRAAFCRPAFPCRASAENGGRGFLSANPLAREAQVTCEYARQIASVLGPRRVLDMKGVETPKRLSGRPAKSV